MVVCFIPTQVAVSIGRVKSGSPALCIKTSHQPLIRVQITCFPLGFAIEFILYSRKNISVSFLKDTIV